MEKLFIKNWIAKNSKLTEREFPKEFLIDCETQVLQMPEKNLIFGEQFFGQYQICDISGNVFFQEEDFYKSKYIVYANKNRPKEIHIPVELGNIEIVVKNYEKHLDTVIAAIKKELLKLQIKTSADEIVQQIFKSLNLSRF